MEDFSIKKTRLDESAVHDILTRFDTMFSPCLSTNINLEEYAKKLSEYANWIICKRSDETAGYIAFYENVETHIAFITSICVLDTFRKFGVATQMLNDMIKSLPDTIFEIKLECRKNNSPAINYYNRNGFAILGEKEDKYILSKALNRQ